MEAAVTIGLDLAKSIFQVHGVDREGAVVVQRRITRGRLLAFCAAAHHWAGNCKSWGIR